MSIPTIIDKAVITGKITLLTGMHIGSSSDFAPIGAVDSVLVRNPIDNRPIIPGSSLKGKLRTLLVKSDCQNPVLNDIQKDSDQIKKLFGSSSPEVVPARLQFYDLFMNEENVKKIDKKSTDLYLTEIKFENTINRLTAVANPRQIERVPAGAVFDFRLIYNIESNIGIEEDIDVLVKALKLIQLDYIGGSGTRGYGKIKITDLTAKFANINEQKPEITEEKFNNLIKEANNYAELFI